MKGRNSYDGGWYSLYGKLSFFHTVPRDVQVVLQLHPALDLLLHGNIRQGVRIPELRPTVHGVLLLGAV